LIDDKPLQTKAHLLDDAKMTWAVVPYDENMPLIVGFLP